MQSFGSTDEKNVLFLDGTDLKISVPAVAACGTRAVHGKQWLRVVGAASAVAEGFGKGELRLRAPAYECLRVYEKESRTRMRGRKNTDAASALLRI